LQRNCLERGHDRELAAWTGRTDVRQADFIVLKIWKHLIETETGISESQEAIDNFTNKQNSADTNKTTTDMNTPLQYMEANSIMTNERKLNCIQA